VGNYDPAAESDRGRDNDGVDRHLAAGVGICEEVSCDPSHPSTCRHDLGETSGEHGVDCLVNASTSVQLDQHDGRDADRRVAPVRTAHRCTDPLMSVEVLPRTRERGDRLAVQD
jgi:hypothetical protein